MKRMILVVSGVMAAALSLELLFAASAAEAAAGETVCPDRIWATKSPPEVGLHSGKLGVFGDYVGGRGCVVRYGYMVYSWGDQAYRGNVFSACKPWITHFLFKAVEEGKLSGVDVAARGIESSFSSQPWWPANYNGSKPRGSGVRSYEGVENDGKQSQEAGTTILALAAGQTRGESTTVRPAEIRDVLHNPDMGWCLYTHGWRSVKDNTANLTSDDAPLFDIVTLDFMWVHLEPENNVFNWDAMDAIIDYWVSRGKQYSMRICMSYYTLYYEKEFGFTPASWEQCDPPDWLFDELGCGYQEVSIKGHTLKRPNYYDPIFLKQHQGFLDALAAHYDKPDNKSAFMEIRSYGRWGEWWDRGFKWADSKQKHDTLAAIIRQYPKTLKHTPFCIAGWKDEDDYSSLHDYMYKMAYDVSESLGVMNRRDGFPKPFESQNYFDQRLWRHWPRIPTIGEDNWQKEEQWGLDQDNYACFLNYHVNVANTWVFNQKYYNRVHEYRDNYEAGLKAGGLGYRFVLTSATYDKQVSAGGVFRLDQTWVNRNVGRAYRVYPLKVYFINQDTGKEIWSGVDGKFDQTPWIKGQSYDMTSRFSIPDNLPSGTYDLRIAMVDGTGTPRISLGIAGGDRQKRYRIGSVTVND